MPSRVLGGEPESPKLLGITQMLNTQEYYDHANDVKEEGKIPMASYRLNYQLQHIQKVPCISQLCYL